MPQNNRAILSKKPYTRVDFTALRAWFNRIPVEKIIDLYYNEDSLYERQCEGVTDLTAWLQGMAMEMAARAATSNPHLAPIIADTRKSGRWGKAIVDLLLKLSESDLSTPKPEDSVAVWFKPRLSDALKKEGILLLSDLGRAMEKRGAGWWRPIPRIGAGKAAVVVAWWGQHESSLGAINLQDDPKMTSDLAVLGEGQNLYPLDRISTIKDSLSGNQGSNRNSAFCLISARNDLDALNAYLYRYRESDKTWRAYRKELERFLLWCVIERRTALSSVLTDACEAYKDFLANIPDHWIGPRISRQSPRWRPFAGQLEPETQRYAIQILRVFFSWLVDVRYLGGNPWVTIADPRVSKKESVLQIDKALPESIWTRLTETNGLIDQSCQNETLQDRRSQFRLVKAAVLLIGSSGLRREEASGASRNFLKPVKGSPLWELQVIGKGNKWRTVYLPATTVDAIRAHWEDRGEDFDLITNAKLLSPVTVPRTEAAARKHQQNDTELPKGLGYSPDGLARAIKKALQLLSQDETLSDEDSALLMDVAPHALRHTFATLAAAKEMPMDVLQRLMGHASQTTTSLYVRAERTRSIKEVEKYFNANP